MANRIFTKEEVSRLIRRAAELEAERTVGGENNSKAGLTMTELEQVAAESGIDPELIHRAAGEMEAGNSETGPAEKEPAKIKQEEIVCEHWLDVQPDQAVLDELVTELNHRYGTSVNDITWWDRLWDSYAGKAKIRKTKTSLEWHYTDEWEYYTTRVLMQKRGNRFRIRVSKRQLWGMSWSSTYNYSTYSFITMIVLMAIGGGSTFSFFGTPWPGLAGALLAGIASYPFFKYFGTRALNKHKQEVADTAGELAELAIQLLNESPYQNKAAKESTGRVIDIEYFDDEDESSSTDRNRLRNNLR